MIDFKYFDYKKFENNAYALYEPVIDCFLILHDSLEYITKLKYILSSRYVLHIVQINLADNFLSSNIDNLCCENWSLSNRSDIDFKSLTNEGNNTVIAKSLCYTPFDDSKYNIVKEKEWTVFCLYWLLFLGINGAHGYSQIDLFLNDFLNLNELGLDSDSSLVNDQLRKDILRALYFGRNLNDTEKEIEELIKDLKLPFYYEQRHQHG